MEVGFNITFTPEALKDYGCSLICRTDRERFVVPVRAYGPRAHLDFPDEVILESKPVKFPSTQVFLVRNIGNCDAEFALDATPSEFAVVPRNAKVPAGGVVQVSVTLVAEEVRDYAGEMEITYNDGIKAYVGLSGSGAAADIYLSQQT